MRKYYDKKGNKYLEFLISKKGQSPKNWVSIDYVINTLLKWLGYGIICIENTEGYNKQNYKNIINRN